MEEKRCCIIHNHYVCPVCKTGYCKPFGEVKTRPIQKCRKCNKTVRMTIKCPFLPLKLIARERTVTEEDVPDNMGE